MQIWNRNTDYLKEMQHRNMDTIKSRIHNEYKSNMDKPDYKYCSDKDIG